MSIPIRPFQQSLPMALLGAREATMQRFRPMLAEFELTEQQWRVLRALASADEPLEVTEVAARTKLLPPSVSRIVARLADHHLIERTTVEHDQRRATLRLTRKGRGLITRVAPHSERIYAEIESAFGPARLSRLLDELQCLTAIAGTTAGEPAGEAS
jgi:homoprotocatechuate degradation regulator HpaR